MRTRKQAFHAGAAIWGVHARQQLAISVVAPADGHDDLIDIAFLGGMVDFHWSRESVQWPVRFGVMSTDEGTVIAPGDASRSRSSLVRQFCSTPLPTFEDVEAGERPLFMIKPGAVGTAGTMTWMLDRVWLAQVSRYRDAENEFGHHNLSVHTPIELLHYDLMIHRDLAFDLPPEVLLCADIAPPFTRTWMMPDQRCTLPVTETIVPLGQPPVISTPDVPRAAEMAEHICGQAGRSIDEFKGYRFTIRYPPVPTVLFLRYPLMSP